MQSAVAVALVIFCFIGAFMLLRKPHYTIVVLMLTFLLEQTLQSYIPALATGFGWLTNVAVGLLAVVAVANRTMQGKSIAHGLGNAAFVCLLILYVYSWANSFGSPARANAMSMNIAGWPYWILLIGIAPLLLSDVAEFRRIVLVFIVVGIVLTLMLSLSPTASFFGGSRFVVETAGMGKGSNPLALGTAGGMLLIASVLFRPERVNIWLNMLRITAFVLGLGLAVASGSRGQVLVGVAVCVVLFPMAYPVRNIFQFFATAVGLVIVLGIAMIVFDAVTGDLDANRWQSEGMSTAVGDRFENALVLFNAYVSSPGSWLTGLGSNAYTSLALQDHGYVHNQLIEICTEQGLIGTVLLGIILFTAFRGARRLFLIYRDDLVMRPAVATLIGLTLFGMGIALKQGSFLGGPGVTFFWIVILTKVSTHEWRMALASDAAWEEEQMLLEEELDHEDMLAMDQPA